MFCGLFSVNISVNLANQAENILYLFLLSFHFIFRKGLKNINVHLLPNDFNFPSI